MFSRRIQIIVLRSLRRFILTHGSGISCGTYVWYTRTTSTMFAFQVIIWAHLFGMTSLLKQLCPQILFEILYIGHFLSRIANNIFICISFWQFYFFFFLPDDHTIFFVYWWKFYSIDVLIQSNTVLKLYFCIHNNMYIEF